MGEDDKIRTRLKCAFVLSAIMEKNKAQYATNLKSGFNDLQLIHNLSQLASSAGLRPATVSSIFNGDSTPSLTSLIHILELLGSSISEFGVDYDNISASDIEKFARTIAQKKERELVKRAKK